jgi:hypothetical protein
MKCSLKCKAVFGLRLLLGVLTFAIGNGQTGGLGLVFQQIETIGPRQWLSLMAGSMVPAMPVGPRIARALPRRLLPGAVDGGPGAVTA